MWFKCISCEVLARMVYYQAALSPHIIDVSLIRRGLHNQPVELRSYLQSMIDDAENSKYDAILLAYGLCGQATAGLVSRHRPLVIPRAHDCITLFLGSRQRYNEQFSQEPGTYWYAQDYIERDDGTNGSLALGSGTQERIQDQYQEFIEKYGKDNADYLMEVMGTWQQHYQRAVYIDVGIGDGEQVEKRAHEEAKRRGWTFEKMQGDFTLVKRLLYGEWEKDYLVLQPGEAIQMTYDENIIGCKLYE
jgi:hypothetical protein